MRATARKCGRASNRRSGRSGRVQPLGWRRRTVGVASGAGRGGGLLEKYRFMSPAWIEMAQEQIAGVLAGKDLRGVDFTLCEEFTGAPDDLRPEGASTIGFFVRVADGSVEVGDQPTDDADFRIVSDYEDALVIARDPDAPAAQQSDGRAGGRRKTEDRGKSYGCPSGTRWPRHTSAALVPHVVERPFSGCRVDAPAHAPVCTPRELGAPAASSGPDTRSSDRQRQASAGSLPRPAVRGIRLVFATATRKRSRS